MPGPAALKGYRRDWPRGDLPAGVTVAAYPVPRVMAYSGVAGLPPVADLWATPPAIAVHALPGSSRSLSAGPGSTTALMTATVVAPPAGGKSGRGAVLAAPRRTWASCTGWRSPPPGSSWSATPT